MADHVSRMVNGWFERARKAPADAGAVNDLVDAIHRMIREAERETKKRCEEVALRAVNATDGARVALAIRTLDPGGAARPGTGQH